MHSFLINRLWGKSFNPRPKTKTWWMIPVLEGTIKSLELGICSYFRLSYITRVTKSKYDIFSYRIFKVIFNMLSKSQV